MESQAREDLGYPESTPGKALKYPLSKERQTYSKQKRLPEKSDVCRVLIKSGALKGYKRLAWEYAEPLIKSGKAELVEYL